MPKLTFVIGATAAGKSYFIKEHDTSQNEEILNVYDYQMRAYDEVGLGDFIPFPIQRACLMKANDELLKDILSLLSEGKDVVVEHTLYKAKRRIVYLDEIRKLPDVKIVIYVLQPGDERWEANLRSRELGSLSSYKAMAESIEFPNPAEGFDEIYAVTDEGIRLRMDPPTPEILEPARAEIRAEREETAREEEAKRKRLELLESMKERKFWHYCEVCGKKAWLTAQEAHEDGWDYPPTIGMFGLLSPRTCGNCSMQDTLYWKIETGGGLPVVIEGDLSPEELITWRRIKEEPESLLDQIEKGES